jgi:hypothetical protein
VAASSLDLLRETVGADAGPDVLDALRRAPDTTIDAAAEHLLATPPRPMRAVAANEIWPLVNASASLLSRGAQGFVDGVGPAGLSGRVLAGTGRRSRLSKRRGSFACRSQQQNTRKGPLAERPWTGPWIVR